MPEPTGAVAIARNEGERLQRCLRSLCGRFEHIVYVDSGSTDGSIEFARSLGVEVVELDLSRPFSMARARNAGMRRLKTQRPDIRRVQLIDGDCELIDGWLERAQRWLDEHPETAIVCGRRRERFPERSVYNRLCDLEWNTPVGPAKACGGDALARLDVILEIGGYEESLIAGEEPEMCLRLRRAGWRVDRIDADMTRHDAALHTFSAWWKRSVRGGYGALDVYERLRHSIEPAEIPFRSLTKSARVWTDGWLAVAVALTATGGIAAGPTGAALGAVVAAALPFAQALRIARGVRERAASGRHALEYGVFTMIGKWAQRQGQLRYRRDVRRGKPIQIIEYKS